MNEILKMLNELTADELDSVIMRASIMLEKKRKKEAEEALREKERQRQEKIEQEKKRQQEIAELQRKLMELQSQKIDIPDEPVKGDSFVMYDTPAAAAAKPAPTPAAPAQAACPHCHQPNAVGSLFCSNCGQRITAAAPQAAVTQTEPSPAPVSQSLAGVAQVCYADESMKKWDMLPGEQSVRSRHEIGLLQPAGGKFGYHMEVTNLRILFYRESAASKNAGMVARMGGGLVGSLIAEGVKAASGAGPKPWLAIPLSAVSSCGLQNKKEFFIMADQTYVLKNKNYDLLLPELVANAKKAGV